MDKGHREGDVMNILKAPAAFVQVIHKQPVSCESQDCVCSVEVTASSRLIESKAFDCGAVPAIREKPFPVVSRLTHHEMRAR